MTITHEQLVTQVQRLENRFQTVEEVMNKIQTAMTMLASLEQLRRINLIRQTDIDSINTTITDILNELALIKAEVFK